MKLHKVSTDDTRIQECLAAVFDDPPPVSRLAQAAAAWIVTGEGGVAAGACVAEEDKTGSPVSGWHIWLLGVIPEARNKGAGRLLLGAVEREARRRCVRALRIKTYQKWQKMRRLLLKRQWSLDRAVPSARHGGVAEEWILPLVPRPFGVVIVGANPHGRGGEWVEAIKELPDMMKVAGICDSDKDILKHWPDYETDTDPQALIRRSKPDAAILALPHDSYNEPRRICLNAGLGILHEKPLACKLKDVLSLQQELTTRPAPIVVGVQRRRHPGYLYLKQAVRNMGKSPCTMVVRMSLGRKDHSGGWRGSVEKAGGGALVDIGYHAVDLVHFLMECPFQVVHCELFHDGRPALEGEVETRAELTGRCGKVWVKVIVDRDGGRKHEEIILDYEKQTLTADREVVKRNGSIEYKCPGSWDAAVRGCLARLAVECMSHPRPPELWDHLSVLQVVQQAYSKTVLAGMTK